jgi:hypothetical protein
MSNINGNAPGALRRRQATSVNNPDTLAVSRHGKM